MSCISGPGCGAPIGEIVGVIVAIDVEALQRSSNTCWSCAAIVCSFDTCSCVGHEQSIDQLISYCLVPSTLQIRVTEKQLDIISAIDYLQLVGESVVHRDNRGRDISFDSSGRVAEPSHKR
jgi:hypothetical protein